MIVVSDTSPLNYLVLIDAEGILATLFGEVIAPPVVLVEMQHPKSPSKVSAWATNLPAWLKTRAPSAPLGVARLGPGESDAIAVGQELKADLLLIDDREGTAAAKRFGLTTAGTLGIIELAAQTGLIEVPRAIARLRRTTFHATDELFAKMLQRDQQRQNRKSRP